MGFNIKVEAVERISEYNGTTKEGTPYVIGSWKVKNVADNSIMLVSCFGVDDATLRNNPGLAMDATLTITCRDWARRNNSGTTRCGRFISSERMSGSFTRCTGQRCCFRSGCRRRMKYSCTAF